MTSTTPFDRTTLRSALDELVGNHGLWPVLRVVVARLFRRRERLLPLGLNAHLRRDLGLDPFSPPGDPPR